MSPKREPVQADDIYRIRQPLECRLSPGGTRAAIVVKQADKETLKYGSHIWIAPTAGGGLPYQFTYGKGGDHHPRFSPDGRNLAFLSGRSEKSEIWIMPVDGGEARQLTKLAGQISDFDFSPDGRRIAAVFTRQDPDEKEREEKKKKGEPGQDTPKIRDIERILYKLDGAGFLPRGRAHLWTIDVASGRGRQITTDDRYDESHPVFSPDGRYLYFNSNRSQDPDIDLDREMIWRVPSRGGPVEHVKTFDGPSSAFSLSPDGRWIAFLGHDDFTAPWGTRHTRLWVVPSGGGRPRDLCPRLDRTCANETLSDTFGSGETAPPVWSPDSAWVYFVVSNEGNSEIWRAPIAKDRPAAVVARPGAIISFAVDFVGRSIYATFSDPSTPGELFRFTPGRELKEERLTAFNTWLEERIVALPEEIRFEGKGRHRLQGWIIDAKGPSRGRGPGVLYIHGGPATQYGNVFFHEFQFLAGRGYTVFYCNPRGGSGYSEKHLASISNAWGSIDYEDLMAFVDMVLKRRPDLDRRRLGVAGGSYGGYMTNWIIGHTRRFGAAVTQRSVSNLMSFSGTSDFGYAWPKVFGGERPWKDPMHYLRMSPITYADQVRTPTLIEHQENDHRCPIEQAEQLFAALRVRKVPVEFHRYPDESHGMSRGGRPDRRIERCLRIAGWLDRWLGARSRRNGRRRPV
jgi:dipeptidyl aminopeptidase/acylaminoacyl peptidase